MSIFSKVKDIFKPSSSVKRKKVYHNVIIRDPDEVWSIKGEIGDGAYGKVYKAEHIINGTLAALKKVSLEEEEDLDNFMVEIDILAECQHPNVVKLLEAYHWEGCLWMYLEFCDGGAVDSIMVDLDRPLTEPQIAYICRNLLQALSYIHQRKVIHRDLKAGNVLLTTEGGVKLADFGVSAKNKNTLDKRGTFIGTPYWLAPEVIKCETFIDSKYDFKADIWSLGITLIEFAQMDPPHHEVSPLRVLLKISKADAPKLDDPSKFSKQFNDFIAQCLIKEPELRPDSNQLLKHPFVNGSITSKPIMALLIEYQAEVVEEDVEEDHRTSRLSIDSEDQSSASQDHSSTASPASTNRHKQTTPTGVTERRASKGPAPPPPVQNKKGPAPAAPQPPTLTTPTAIGGQAPTAAAAIVITPPPPSSPPPSPSVDTLTNLTTTTATTVPPTTLTTPATVDTTVVAQPITPVTQPTTPVTQSTISVTQSTTPVTQSTTPVTQSTTPVTPPPSVTYTSSPPTTEQPTNLTNSIVSSSPTHTTTPSVEPCTTVSISDAHDISIQFSTPSSTTTTSGPADATSSISTIINDTSSNGVVVVSSDSASIVTASDQSNNISSGVCVGTEGIATLTAGDAATVVCSVSSSPDASIAPDVSMVSITTLGDDGPVTVCSDSAASAFNDSTVVLEEDKSRVVDTITTTSTSKTQISSGVPEDVDTSDVVIPSTTVVCVKNEESIVAPLFESLSANHSNVTTVNMQQSPDVVSSNVTISTNDSEEQVKVLDTSVSVESPSSPLARPLSFDSNVPMRNRRAEMRQRAPDSPGGGHDTDFIGMPPQPILDQDSCDASMDSSGPASQILASIGSEGTIIVRTPTPTSPTTQTQEPFNESVVTFSGPSVVESPRGSPRDAPPSAGSPTSIGVSDTSDVDLQAAEAEAMRLLEDVIDEHRGVNDSMTSTDSAATAASLASQSVVSPMKREPQQEVVVAPTSILEEESNTDDDLGGHSNNRSTRESHPEGAVDATSEAHHISVVPVAESTEDGSQRRRSTPTAGPDTLLTIEGTTEGDTDVDSLVTGKDALSSPVSEGSSSGDSGRGGSPSPITSNGRVAAPPASIVPQHASNKALAEDRSDSDSVSTAGSEKENNKPRGAEDEVVLRRPFSGSMGRSISTDTTASTMSSINRSVNSIGSDSTLVAEDATLKPIDKNRQNRQQNNAAKSGRTKDEIESLALRRKTRKRTRKFMIDGVVVTTTTSKVIYGDDEEGTIMTSDHLARKQELRELKILQKMEQKQFQELGVKASIARQEQERKFDAEKSALLRSYDTDVDALNRHQKQQVERAESQQEVELKSASKKIRADQDRELKAFRESLKVELKLLKQEVDLLPKDARKDALKLRKEQLDADQSEREKVFLERLHQSHESSMKRLSEEHRCRVALLERQFLQKKHQLLRAREAALWELEERHLHDRHQLAKRQLKDIFFLQRHQMLLRHEKELEQVRRQNVHREEELVKRQAVERRHMPKRIRQEMKARELMFRESMRISTTNLPDSHHDEKERLRKFQECEKRRYEAEKKRAEQKHKRQMEELQAATESHAKELEQLQNEKRKMLMEHETLKLKAQEEEYQRELRDWKNNLKPRKQKLEEEFEQQLQEQEQFYGAYLNEGGSALLAAAANS